MAALLDVNVLVALAWPTHIHHRAAHRWFAARRNEGWATCALTQAAFVRLSGHPGAGSGQVRIREALRVLETNASARDHHFWSLDSGLVGILPEIRERLIGHQQIADALLLDLAIRKGGTLATYDRRVENLLPANSPHRGAIRILPID